MRLISTITLFLWVMSVSAQKKLKYDIIKSTGDTLFRTSEKRLYTHAGGSKALGEILESTVYKSKNGISLAIDIQTGRTNTFTIKEGSRIQLKQKNGESVSLYANSYNSSRNSLLGYGCTMLVFYRVSKKDITQLKSSPIDFIVIQSSTGDMDYQLKEKAGDIIPEQLTRIEQD